MSVTPFSNTPKAMTTTPQTAPAATAAHVPPAAARAGFGLGREVLSFRLGLENYGIDILNVQEIKGYAQPTRIANAPSYVLGVLNLRGVIVPIVDLRRKFGLDDVRYDESTVTIILNVGRRVVGVVADGVSDVLNLPHDRIKPSPSFSSAVDAGFVTGLASLSDADDAALLIVLDIARLIGSADIGLEAVEA